MVTVSKVPLPLLPLPYTPPSPKILSSQDDIGFCNIEPTFLKRFHAIVSHSTQEGKRNIIKCHLFSVKQVPSFSYHQVVIEMNMNATSLCEWRKDITKFKSKNRIKAFFIYSGPVSSLDPIKSQLLHFNFKRCKTGDFTCM